MISGIARDNERPAASSISNNYKLKFVTGRSKGKRTLVSATWFNSWRMLHFCFELPMASSETEGARRTGESNMVEKLICMLKTVHVLNSLVHLGKPNVPIVYVCPVFHSSICEFTFDLLNLNGFETFATYSVLIQDFSAFRKFRNPCCSSSNSGSRFPVSARRQACARSSPLLRRLPEDRGHV